MKVRLFDKIVLEAPKGISFETSRGPNGELVIRAINSLDGYSLDYKNPPIPEGFTYKSGKWNTGFIIERTSDGSRFIWVPVGILESDGVLDKEHSYEKFGRRNFVGEEDLRENEVLEKELKEQWESVKKYGGFYISLYYISKILGGKPESRANSKLFVGMDFHVAKQIGDEFESSETVKSHLLFGAEFDSFQKMLEKLEEFAENFNNSNPPKEEWTQERVKGRYAIRTQTGSREPAYFDESSLDTGFRVALTIK